MHEACCWKDAVQSVAGMSLKASRLLLPVCFWAADKSRLASSEEDVSDPDDSAIDGSCWNARLKSSKRFTWLSSSGTCVIPDFLEATSKGSLADNSFSIQCSGAASGDGQKMPAICL